MPPAPALRAPDARDAKAVAALLRARERQDLGAEETTAADVREEWAALGEEAGLDAWVAEGERGLAGYAHAAGADLLVAVHPDAVGRGLGARAARDCRAAGTRARRPRGTTVHPVDEHRGPDPPAGGGLVAGPPLLPHAHRLSRTPRPAPTCSRGPSTPTATPRRSGTWSRARTPASRATCRSRWRAGGPRAWRRRAGTRVLARSSTTRAGSSAPCSASAGQGRDAHGDHHDRRGGRSRARARPRPHARPAAARRVPRGEAAPRRGVRTRTDRGGRARLRGRRHAGARETERWEKVLGA